MNVGSLTVQFRSQDLLLTTIRISNDSKPEAVSMNGKMA